MKESNPKGHSETTAPQVGEQQPVAGLWEVMDGLVFANNRTDANTGELHNTASTLMALVELLVERGLIDRAELDRRRAGIAVRLRRAYVARGMSVTVHEPGFSKYALADEGRIDCESRLHLCQAACCRLSFSLSREDVDEGTLRWDFGAPYMIARGERGYCAHIDRGTCRCTVYGQRPVICRRYDCRHDERIWSDFENKVVNPDIGDPGWPDWVGERPPDPDNE